MHLTLCLPGLLLPRQALLDTVIDLRLPAWMRLLGKARLRRGEPATDHLFVMKQWNLDGIPAAALRLLGEGGEPGEADWINLDPVHLTVDRRGVKLADPAALALDEAEDAALREAIAPLFAQLGELSALRPGHWYLKLAGHSSIVTAPLPYAIGQPVDPMLPGGDAGPQWRRLLAEAQSVLHTHPVNRARDAVGKPLVNHLWPWGEGRLPSHAAAPCDALWASDPILLGLARATGISGRTPPPSFEIADGRVLAIIDDLAGPARQLDALAWRDALLRIEDQWVAPALGALAQGRCASLRVVGFGPDASVDMAVARLDLLKFWRRPQPLTRLAA